MRTISATGFVPIEVPSPRFRHQANRESMTFSSPPPRGGVSVSVYTDPPPTSIDGVSRGARKPTYCGGVPGTNAPFTVLFHR